MFMLTHFISLNISIWIRHSSFYCNSSDFIFNLVLIWKRTYEKSITNYLIIYYVRRICEFINLEDTASSSVHEITVYVLLSLNI